MATLFSDSFTDTNGVQLQSHVPNVGTNWVRYTGGEVESYKTIDSNRATGLGAYYARFGGSFGGLGDGILSVDVQDDGGFVCQATVFARSNGGAIGQETYGYYAVYDYQDGIGTKLWFYKQSGTELWSGMVGRASSPTNIEIKCEGTTITLSYGGVVKWTGTDSYKASGYWGIGSDSQVYYDNFLLSDVVVSPPTGPSGLSGSCLVNYVPVPSFVTSDPMPDEGEAITFTSSSSGAAAVSWSWDFGNGDTSTQENPVYTYNDPGVYRVTLVVTTAAGYTSAYSQTVTVSSTSATTITVYPPAATISASPSHGYLVGGDLSVAFSCVGVGSIASYAWDFGDGGSSSAEDPTHIYHNPGTYAVSLTVTGTGTGMTSTATCSVIVASSQALDNPEIYAPVGNLDASDHFINDGGSVTFTPDLSTTNGVTYTWDFGDGTVETSTTGPIAHEFASEGLYVVTLTVSNDFGSTTMSTTVTVRGTGLPVRAGRGFVYSLDKRGHRINRYAAASGSFDGFFGGYGTSAGKLKNPTTFVVNTPIMSG